MDHKLTINTILSTLYYFYIQIKIQGSHSDTDEHESLLGCYSRLTSKQLPGEMA
jgi:hypothetical protein